MFIDRVFVENKVNEVGVYYVVEGYFDLNLIFIMWFLYVILVIGE